MLETRFNDLAQGVVEIETKQNLNYRNSVIQNSEFKTKTEIIEAQIIQINNNIIEQQSSMSAALKTMGIVGTVFVGIITCSGVLVSIYIK